MSKLLKKRRAVLLGSALAPLLTAAPAFAQEGPAPAAPATADTTSQTAAAQRPARPLSGTVEPKWGNIRSFWGDVSPFWGNIRSFWGDISPYEGDLTAFWGNIRSFNDGSGTSGSLAPYWGNIRSFWGDVGASWGNIRSFWGNIRSFSESPDDYASLAAQLDQLIDQSEAFWGPAVEAQTGTSFAEGFANPLLAKYGIDLNDPGSLERLDANAREHFFMDWYDGLMNFSGADHVDHWMKSINWTPAITHTIGEGRDSVIGLLDFSVTGEGTRNIVKYDGISTFANGHGAAVASLMIAAHDGKGVMGIAPMASVVAYNPFDETGTAGWADIRNGVLMLSQNGASIVNMSLGVPGWTLHQGWNDVFSDPAVASATKDAIFVVAAGNDGIVQSQNINWNYATNPNLIVVGSVDPTGTISGFSNRPGNACLLNNGRCEPGGRLMDRFIVAPGEFILVADGKGGVTRMSGTSFAAPLVSGTVALLHDRWPWLANYAKESVDIILKSAKDLGAPGVDPVYGVGELDVIAALSPLDFNQLKWYQYDAKGNLKPEQISKIRSPKEQAKWEAAGMFFYAYEDIGRTFRDFAIPVSSKLVGQSALSAGGSFEQLQAYIYSRMMDWLKTGAAGGPGKGLVGFASTTASVPNAYGLDVQFSMAPRQRLFGYRDSSMPYQSALRLSDQEGRFALMLGDGDGAVAVGGSPSFGFASDYDPVTGGANPLLGFASGNSFAGASAALGERFIISANVTERTLRRDLRWATLGEQLALDGVAPYRAGAQQVNVGYRLSDDVDLRVSYTRLREQSALFGVQSIDPMDFAGGSTTDGLTLGADVALSPTLALAASGTLARTREGDARRQSMAVGEGGLVSTSFQLALTKERLMGVGDRLRLSLSQPMHLERGTIDFSTVKVVDRQTGELGIVTDSFDIATKRRQFVADLVYGRPVLGGAAELNLFGRANLAGGTSDALPSFVAGTSMKLGF